MASTVWLVLPLVAVGVLVFGAILTGLVLSLRALKQAATTEVRAAHPDVVLIDEMANCFGFESAGVLQVRGNGCLFATTDGLGFRQWVPSRERIIPRAAIERVEVVRSHLGKTQGAKLLKVVFRGESGPDSVAWRVRELEAWLRELERR